MPALAGSPLAELLEDDPVGEALAADADAFQHTVAAQLVQHEVRVQFPSLTGKDSVTPEPLYPDLAQCPIPARAGHIPASRGWE